MSDRIRTLLLEANGTHWAAVAIDTIGQGLFTRRGPAGNSATESRLLRKLFGQRYADASYMTDWKEAFCSASELDVETCNITNLLEFRSSRPAIREYDFVVVLHSAAGDRMGLLTHTAAWFQGRRGKLAVFVGNEYDLMDEKISFVQRSGADYVCTQLPIETGRALYHGSGATVVAMPHALNPHVYRSMSDAARPIDIGFVGDLYDRLIGDRERTSIVDYFARAHQTHGLRVDMRLQRMPRAEWASYLNTCSGVVGAESGTYFLQRDGHALKCAKAYVKRHGEASFDAVFAACFADPGPVLNGKAISSRHFEPIGTATCQLLIEGGYNGILVADRHYIAVKRDLSNIDDAIARFKDPQYRGAITTAAHRHVMAEHTYDCRVRELVRVAFGADAAQRPLNPSPAAS